MCTYNITIDDGLMERVRPAFADNTAIAVWMQSQVESILMQMASDMEEKSKKTRLSQRLRCIAHAPKDFDYKEELAKRF